ncbi:MAG: NADH:flavin oxidoreductase [Erythrobacter sp.]|uniref:NADH:flavin oxidoreductase n=1 Tax=Erythrobacter sp. TaxID=1042 RepID=UPI00260F3ED1|nr:NADH:flavin oxidoreductase [Erythrobacter sp.]MDJ0979696.1 NADH:flavin oxidoreductase [Erythrobacter sp.]
MGLGCQNSALFSRAKLGSLELANRIVMAPMTRSRSPGGIPGEAMADYYARRARAGVGLIITEGTSIDRPFALDDPNVPRFHGAEALNAWSGVVAAVHAEGGKIIPQLWHVGAFAGARSAWDEDEPGIESPSGLQAPDHARGHAMTQADIDAAIAAYEAAAKNAVELGFDGVEIHGAHGYLIDQFMWEETNNRADLYGGSDIASRMRFAAEVVTAVRRAVPTDFPVLFRFSQFKQQDYTARLAQTPAELEAVLQPLVDAGVSVFHASQRRFWDPEFDGSDLNLAGWAKKVSGLPSVTVGSVGLSGDYISNRANGEVSEPSSLDRLLERLEAEEFDLVAVGRALLMDPFWVEKIRDGRENELKPFDISALSEYY